MANVKRCKYDRPTPVQRLSIPIGLAGRDLMACAQTGSGKTAAFCFPILANILKSGAQPTGRSRKAFPLALVLSPTRELSSQIYDEARKFCYQTGIRPVVVYGGAPVVNQVWHGAICCCWQAAALLCVLSGCRFETFSNAGLSCTGVPGRFSCGTWSVAAMCSWPRRAG